MPETTPLIKAALNLRAGAGFDVYLGIALLLQLLGKEIWRYVYRLVMMTAGLQYPVVLKKYWKMFEMTKNG